MSAVALYGWGILWRTLAILAGLGAFCLAALFTVTWWQERTRAAWDERYRQGLADEYGSEPFDPGCECAHCDDARELVELDRWLSSLRPEVAE